MLVRNMLVYPLYDECHECNFISDYIGTKEISLEANYPYKDIMHDEKNK